MKKLGKSFYKENMKKAWRESDTLGVYVHLLHEWIRAKSELRDGESLKIKER